MECTTCRKEIKHFDGPQFGLPIEDDSAITITHDTGITYWEGCRECFAKAHLPKNKTSRVSREEIRELLYDLGFRGLEGRQDKILSNGD